MIQTEEKDEPKSAGSTPFVLSLTPICQKLQDSNATLALKSFGSMLPSAGNKSKNPQLSADSFCIFSYVCGVADGVSQWKQYKINPKFIGEEILEKSCQYINNHLGNLKEQEFTFQDVSKDALKYAYDNAKNWGSCTVLFYYLQQNIAHITYIGDSLLAIFRPSFSQSGELENITLIFKTTPNCFKFNYPCQLIKWPDERYIKQLKQYHQRQLSTLINASQKVKMISSEDCVQAKIPVQENDIIIAATDGVFDNMTDQEMSNFLLQNMKKKTNLQTIIDMLVEQCWLNSKNEHYCSPFQKEASKHGLKHSGGKPDDCTAVLSIIENIQ